MPRATESPHARRDRSAWWQAVLVLAPLLLLAALGARGLQVSRGAALDLARRQSESACALLLERVAAELAELARTFPAPALFPELPPPTPPNEAQELLRRAIDSPSDETARYLREIADRHPDAVAESGVPLLPIVAWMQLRIASDTESAFDALARAAVETHPSVLSPELLDRAASLLEARQLDRAAIDPWRNRWRADERLRRVMRLNEARLASSKGSLWIGDELPTPSRWWVEIAADGRAFAVIPKPRLATLAEEVIHNIESALPEYADASVSLAGEDVQEARSNAEQLARAERGRLAVTLFLGRPEKLYEQQFAQTAWFSALIACAVAAGLAGYIALRRAVERERQLGELKSNFVASVSHELRAPIASIRVMAENLETGVVRDHTRRGEYHRLISEECRRLSALIDNVLDFARIEQNRKSYHFAETDIPPLVRDAIDLVQPRAAQRRQTIGAEFEPLDPPPLCDGLAVQQALINLLDNAIKFSPEATAIAIRVRGRGAAAWELSVTDSGPGIPHAEHAQIFERFYRIGSELRRETQGAGIGLSIVKHIAGGHGGTVEVQSEPCAGATFTLVLPRVPPGSNTTD